MSAFKPTASQQAAIETRGSAVLVSAGAGSGKTKVLTERLMGFVTDSKNPADLDSFLIITFTRAAAAELRGRIMDELANALAEDPGNRRLRRQSALCRRAQIGTIHSFCANILRENSHLAGLSPDFKIVDDDRAANMKAMALERVMEKCYEESDRHPGFLELADTVGAGRDDHRLSELVLSLHSKMQCHARPERWAKQQVELLSAEYSDAAETPWGREIMDAALERAEYWTLEFDRLMGDMLGEAKIAAAYLPSVTETAEAVRELARCLRIGWDRARDCFPIPFNRLGTLRNSPDPALSERVKSRREACRKAMTELQDSFYAESSSLIADMRLTAPAMAALLNLTLEFDREYSREKRRSALVDYSDLEHITAALLTDENDEPSELALRISSRFTEIMVDEYQDVNQVQDTIFRAISKAGRNLFMVGDVKQSIYRFRLADPGIFTDKYLRYKDDADAAYGEPRRIMLQENFRSRRQILDAANSVFSICMSRSLGDLDYDEDAALKCGASYEGDVPLPELMLMALPKAEDDEESPDKIALEARLVAEKIRELVESGATVSDKGRQRPMEYGDVAILLRSANNVGGIYRRELAQAGVPVSAGQGGGFFSSVEVSTVMSMLALIDNPHQDIPLIAVLRSPAFRFSPNELSEIRRKSDKDYYSALLSAAEENEKCAGFVALLTELRSAAPDMSAAELVWHLLDRLDMLAICSAMSDGVQRRARLMELVELSEKFEGTGYKGLHRFVLYLRRLAEKGQEPTLGAESGSAVQIMSVHKSKGLEFPVVFLCDTARRFNKQDSRDTVLVHPQLGLGSKVTDLQRRVEYPTLARNAVKLRLEREMLSEEMRLLYVAMTRPKERLYITAAVREPEELIEKAIPAVTVPMAPAVLQTAAGFVNWLVYAALADGQRRMKIGIYEAPALSGKTAETESEGSCDEAAYAELERLLRYSYPHKAAESLPSKLTATELKGRVEKDEDAVSIAPRSQRSFKMPDFTKKDKPLSATEKGTATHLVLQYMDFSKSGSLEEIRGEIERMLTLRCISEREAQAVDAEAIFNLFASPLGKRMLSSENMRREFKFSLLWDANAVYADAGEEELLMQGVVDCFFEEKGKLVVVDYKTDKLRNRAEALERAEVYRGQLAAYAASLGRICNMEVSECVLYFLSVGEAISLKIK